MCWEIGRFFFSDVVSGSGNRTFYWMGPLSNGDAPSSLMHLMRPSPPPIEEFADGGNE